MDRTFLQSLHEWQSFYALTGEVAGTLIGLMFIAMSLSSRRPAEDTPQADIEYMASKVRTFVSPTIIHLTAVVVIASVMSMPLRGPLSLSVCLGIVGVSGIGYVGVTLQGLRRHNRQRTLAANHWANHFYLPCLCYAAAVATSIALPFTRSVLPALAVSVVLFLVIGIRNSWLATLFMSGLNR